MIELTLAVLVAMRPFAPAVSLTGSVGASIMFAITLSFLLSRRYDEAAGLLSDVVACAPHC